MAATLKCPKCGTYCRSEDENDVARRTPKYRIYDHTVWEVMPKRKARKIYKAENVRQQVMKHRVLECLACKEFSRIENWGEF